MVRAWRREAVMEWGTFMRPWVRRRPVEEVRSFEKAGRVEGGQEDFRRCKIEERGVDTWTKQTKNQGW